MYIRESIFDLHIYITITSPYLRDRGVTISVDDREGDVIRLRVSSKEGKGEMDSNQYGAFFED